MSSKEPDFFVDEDEAITSPAFSRISVAAATATGTTTTVSAGAKPASTSDMFTLEAPGGTVATAAPASKAKPEQTRIQKNKIYTCPTISKDGFHVDPAIWELLVFNTTFGQNTMLTGPTGTGKTELIMKLGKVLDMPVVIHDMGAIIDPISSLIGVHRLATNEKGESESMFDLAQFAEDIQKPCIILLDELSRAPATSLNILFPLLDVRRELNMSIASSKLSRRIPVHPECRFIATANIGSDYTGTSSLDRALADRFHIIELDFMAKDQETELLIKRTNVDEKVASTIADYASRIRKLAQDEENLSLSTCVSTRHTLMAANLVVNGMDLLNALKHTFLPLFTGTIRSGEKQQVFSIITSK